MNISLHKWLWLLPIVTHSLDANAWGLLTHVYFAQSLLWAMPLLDPRLQAAIKRFPELVMAGACLPDLAIVSPVFRHTHHWENAHELLLSASTEEETAIAIGYASHLYIDVIAHNHFVPAHEAMWLEYTMLTHIASEWAMDAYLAPLVAFTPGRLLHTHRKVLTRFIAPRFRCSESRTSIALQRLAFWDNVLRRVRLPEVIYYGMRFLDKHVLTHFIYYIAKTQTAMWHINSVLQGLRPQWEPELHHSSPQQMMLWRQKCFHDLRMLHPMPITFFTINFDEFELTGFDQKAKEIPAITTPISAPANTSLG